MTSKRSGHTAHPVAPSGYYKGSKQAVAFGPGARSALSAFIHDTGVRRAMVVTGPTVAASDVCRLVVGELEPHCRVAVFAGSAAHSPMRSVEAGEAMAIEFRPDLLVSVGGSSHVDVAKTIKLRAKGQLTELLQACVTTTLSGSDDDRRN